jgi:hypothetical protein
VTLLRNFGATQGPVLKSLCITRSTAGPDFQITQHPKSAVVDLGGGPTQFAVTTAGSGLSYQWYKDGTAVAGGIGQTFTINDAQYANTGVYKVRVTKSGALLDSAEARLHVVSTPTDRPWAWVDDASPLLSHSVTFSAWMDVSPSVGRVYYQWRKNGVPITGAHGWCDDSDDPIYRAGYTNPSVVCQDTGEYSVVFTNQYWKVANWAYDPWRVVVSVQDQTGPVPMVTVGIVDDTGQHYPLPITDKDEPPTLKASTCLTPEPTCCQWYRTDSMGLLFREPIPGANSLEYMFPDPVPCEMFDQYDYFMVEVFDQGRFPYRSTPLRVYGQGGNWCEP